MRRALRSSPIMIHSVAEVSQMVLALSDIPTGRGRRIRNICSPASRSQVWRMAWRSVDTRAFFGPDDSSQTRTSPCAEIQSLRRVLAEPKVRARLIVVERIQSRTRRKCRSPHPPRPETRSLKGEELGGIQCSPSVALLGSPNRLHYPTNPSDAVALTYAKPAERPIPDERGPRRIQHAVRGAAAPCRSYG